LYSDKETIGLANNSLDWFMETAPDETHTYIISKQYQTMLSLRSNGSLYLSLGEGPEDAAEWSLEFLSGELCFLSHASSNMSLSLNMTGHLGLLQQNNNSKKKASTVWRFIEAGNGGELWINSWARPRFYLCSDSNRRVFTTTNRQMEGTRWAIAKNTNGSSVLIQSAKYGHVLALNGSSVVASDDDDVSDHGWMFEAAHSNIFHFHLPCRGKSIAYDSLQGGIVALDAVASKKPERFRLERSDKCGQYAIRACTSGKFVGATSIGQVTLSTEVGPSELWDIIESPHGGFFIMSTLHDAQLLFRDDIGVLMVDRDQYEAQSSWVLQPAGLPNTLSDGKKLALVGAGVGALALSVAVPFAVVGIGGLLVEAVAAEAIIAGVGGGLLLGGAVIGSTAVFVPNKNWRHGFAQSFLLRSNQNHDDPLLQDCTLNRPLCAWESW
jgi:hypothetical protein